MLVVPHGYTDGVVVVVGSEGLMSADAVARTFGLDEPPDPMRPQETLRAALVSERLFWWSGRDGRGAIGRGSVDDHGLRSAGMLRESRLPLSKLGVRPVQSQMPPRPSLL